MILDSITHVTPDGSWFNTTFDASERRLLKELNTASAKRAVVVALADYIPNDYVLEVCERHPEQLIPGASINPAKYATEKEAVSALREQLQGGPFRVLKLHPRLNSYDPSDPRSLAILEELASWKSPLPVWLDSLLYYQGGSLRKSLVDTIHEIVGRFQKINFVILHAGGSWALQVAEAVRDCQNAFLDISFTLCRYRNSSVWEDLRFLIEKYDRKIIFGSDFPEFSTSQALDYFRDLTTDLSTEKCANVLGANLHRILFED
jgi:predicted TIM-barrel fold metal-dependent hydrolase